MASVAKSGVEDAESADGLDVMMLAAEQMNVSLTSVWHAVRGWHKTRQQLLRHEPVRKRHEIQDGCAGPAGSPWYAAAMLSEARYVRFAVSGRGA